MLHAAVKAHLLLSQTRNGELTLMHGPTKHTKKRTEICVVSWRCIDSVNGKAKRQMLHTARTALLHGWHTNTHTAHTLSQTTRHETAMWLIRITKSDTWTCGVAYVFYNSQQDIEIENITAHEKAVKLNTNTETEREREIGE